MSDNDYNGWTNYPTWNINLWLKEGFFGHPDELLKQIRKLKSQTVSYVAATASFLKNLVYESRSVLGHDSWPTPDLDPQDLEKVNWYELAECWSMDAEP